MKLSFNFLRPRGLTEEQPFLKVIPKQNRFFIRGFNLSIAQLNYYFLAVYSQMALISILACLLASLALFLLFLIHPDYVPVVVQSYIPYDCACPNDCEVACIVRDNS